MKYTKNKWKVIKKFKNVKDFVYGVNCYGDVKNLDTGEILKKKIANKKHHPYYAVYLLHNDGKKRWVLVHQLVATFFVKIPDNLSMNDDIVPDHLDNDGLNNFYKNLEWKTRGQNVSDAFKKGYINNSGENHKDTFITEKQANKICDYLEKELDYDSILEKMNFPKKKKYRTLITRIKNGLSWTNVSKNYKIKKDKTSYTKEQRKTIEKIPLIIELYDKGFKTKEIFNIVYKDEKCNKENKMNTIRLICKNKIYKKEISDFRKDKHSTTRES